MSGITREEFTLSFQGKVVDDHEIDVNVLVDSLIAMKGLAERANTVLHGKQAEMFVKVKGGFKAGSFDYTMLFEWCMPCAPIAIPAAAAIAPVLTTIVHTINLGKMLRGEKPKIMGRDGDFVTVQNTIGEQGVFNNCVINLYNSSGTRQDISKLVAPLGNGLEAIDILPPDKLEKVTLQESDKACFAPVDGDRIDENSKEYILELLTPNLDGKSSGWRFFDPEENCEFTASISDEAFLKDVVDGKYMFARGNTMRVDITIIKKMVNQRKRTERVIKEVFAVEKC